MKHVAKSVFKPRAFEYLRMVQEQGEPLIITDHGRAAVRIEPVAPGGSCAGGSLEGSIRTYEAPEQPVDIESWEALR